MAHKVVAHALIPAAGRGARFGSARNKVFYPLAGRPLIAWSLQAFAGHVDTLTIVAREQEMGLLEKILGTMPSLAGRVIAGGDTRQESVARGLDSLQGAHGDDIVLVHDAARPLVTSALILRCITQAREQGSAVAALPVVDTLKEAARDARSIRTVDRTGLWAVQTPQAFRLSLLRQALEAAQKDGFCGTDEASLVERLNSEPVRLVEGARENIKITTPADMEFAAQWLSEKQRVRVGIGYDIHRLVAGRPLWLGGVQIEHYRGLDGHSDADVVIHALCDALLGAAGLPDIGQAYPNSDPAYAGISSRLLLADVAKRLAQHGWRVGNADCMVIAEEPKIASYAPQMREQIAQVLGADSEAISIKATTNEGLGALGAGLGIACHATATLVRL